MSFEILLLHGKRCVVPISIQAGFADGNHARMIGQFDDLIPISGIGLGGRIGMNSHRREYFRMIFGQADCIAA